jgi:hypothetical protein
VEAEAVKEEKAAAGAARTHFLRPESRILTCALTASLDMMREVTEPTVKRKKDVPTDMARVA